MIMVHEDLNILIGDSHLGKCMSSRPGSRKVEWIGIEAKFKIGSIF